MGDEVVPVPVVTNLSSFLSNSFCMNNSQSISDLYSIPAMATAFSHCSLKSTVLRLPLNIRISLPVGIAVGKEGEEGTVHGSDLI